MTVPRVAIFGPHPLLTVTLERESPERERIHFHPGGQGVWVARMIASLGAEPVLCGFIGGEAGNLLEGLLRSLGGELRLVRTASQSGCYVTDRRSGERKVVACALSEPPSRHELDELFSLTCAEAIAAGWLVVANPMPAEALPLQTYGDLVADAHTNGCRTLVDLSSPRLDSALAGEPDLVKLNDWELAAFVSGPVSEPAQLLAAARQLRDAGAGAVIVTRGEQPALVLASERVCAGAAHAGEQTPAGEQAPPGRQTHAGERAWWLTPPRLEHGHREGCGDAMMGALAAAWAREEDFERALIVGAAAGAANFLRHGLGSASREVVERLQDSVALEPITAA